MTSFVAKTSTNTVESAGRAHSRPHVSVPQKETLPADIVVKRQEQKGGGGTKKKQREEKEQAHILRKWVLEEVARQLL